MPQRSLQHAPAHDVAELDHPRGEPFAEGREGLDRSAGEVVFARNEVDGEFVAEIAELEGGVEAAVDAGRVDFGGCAGGEGGGRAVGPDGG